MPGIFDAGRNCIKITRFYRILLLEFLSYFLTRGYIYRSLYNYRVTAQLCLARKFSRGGKNSTANSSKSAPLRSIRRVLSRGFSRDISRSRFSDKAPVGRRAKPHRRWVLIGRQSQSAAENLEAHSWYAVGGWSRIKGFSFEFHVSQLRARDNPGRCIRGAYIK